MAHGICAWLWFMWSVLDYGSWDLCSLNAHKICAGLLACLWLWLKEPIFSHGSQTQRLALAHIFYAKLWIKEFALGYTSLRLCPLMTYTIHPYNSSAVLKVAMTPQVTVIQGNKSIGRWDHEINRALLHSQNDHVNYIQIQCLDKISKQAEIAYFCRDSEKLELLRQTVFCTLESSTQDSATTVSTFVYKCPGWHNTHTNHVCTCREAGGGRGGGMVISLVMP